MNILSRKFALLILAIALGGMGYSERTFAQSDGASFGLGAETSDSWNSLPLATANLIPVVPWEYAPPDFGSFQFTGATEITYYGGFSDIISSGSVPETSGFLTGIWGLSVVGMFVCKQGSVIRSRPV